VRWDEHSNGPTWQGYIAFSNNSIPRPHYGTLRLTETKSQPAAGKLHRTGASAAPFNTPATQPTRSPRTVQIIVGAQQRALGWIVRRRGKAGGNAVLHPTQKRVYKQGHPRTVSTWQESKKGERKELGFTGRYPNNLGAAGCRVWPRALEHNSAISSRETTVKFGRSLLFSLGVRGKRENW